jgi:hypothetical protein
MKFVSKIICSLILITVSTSSFAVGSHRVRGYTKINGTYVPPHRQTNPNKTQRDNYSSRPNINPYTGKRGTKTPRY